MSKKSSSPKRVTKDENGEPTYYFQYSDDRTQVMVTMVSKNPFSGTDEVLADLQTFVDDCVEQETQLFDGADLDADGGLIH